MKKLYILFIVFIVSILGACGGDSDQPEADGIETNQQAEENAEVALNNIDVQTEGLSYDVTGDVQAKENVIYYVLEHEGDVIEEETEINIEETEGWGNFEISGELPEAVTDSEEPPTLILYGKNEEGEQVNSNFIPIDLTE